jgi:hypothetical protein
LNKPIQNNTLNFELFGLQETVIKVQIFNAIGKNIRTKEMLVNGNGSYQIQLHDLTAGVYLLQVQQERNTITRKFLIK